MKLSIEEVEHIASLARLSLTQHEKQRFTEQLSDILDYASRLDELNTDDIPPTANILETDLRLREDVVQPCLTQKAVLGNAAETEDGQFKIPPVMGQ